MIIHQFSQNTVPLNSSGIVKSENFILRILHYSAYSENMRKIFKHLCRIRWKYFAVFGEYVESIIYLSLHEEYDEVIAEHKIVSETAESTYLENTQKVFKRTWRKRQTNLAVS